nr:formin-like protein 5 [Aegilops tauschii subsp. strangulata]
MPLAASTSSSPVATPSVVVRSTTSPAPHPYRPASFFVVVSDHHPEHRCPNPYRPREHAPLPPLSPSPRRAPPRAPVPTTRYRTVRSAPPSTSPRARALAATAPHLRLASRAARALALTLPVTAPARASARCCTHRRRRSAPLPPWPWLPGAARAFAPPSDPTFCSAIAAATRQSPALRWLAGAPPPMALAAGADVPPHAQRPTGSRPFGRPAPLLARNR